MIDELFRLDEVERHSVELHAGDWLRQYRLQLQSLGLTFWNAYKAGLFPASSDRDAIQAFALIIAGDDNLIRTLDSKGFPVHDRQKMLVLLNEISRFILGSLPLRETGEIIVHKD